jgi:hypothetical protein
MTTKVPKGLILLLWLQALIESSTKLKKTYKIVVHVFNMDIMYTIESFISLEDYKHHQDKFVI